MLSLYIALIAAKVQIAALQMTPPEVVTEYVEVPVYITEYVPYYVTETVEVPTVEKVYIPPEEWTVVCGACGKVTDWRAYTYGVDGSEVPICYDCWEYGGCTGWFHPEDEEA